MTLAVCVGTTAAAPFTNPHAIELRERVLHPEDGLLLGNGDLSVSVYQDADRIVWRFGKGDVWDRRLDLSDDPKPAHICQIAHGIHVEGWKCPPYGGPVEATRTTGYPVLRDCALFYTDFMRKGEDGFSHVFPSNQGEDGFTGNAKDCTDRPQIMQHLRYALRAAIQASEVLGADSDLRAQWRDRLEHCAGDDGKPPAQLAGIERICREANPPEFGAGRPYRAQPTKATGQPWPSEPTTWHFGQYPWSVMGHLRGGHFIADRDFPVFREIVQRWRHPNGLLWGMAIANYGRAGAWTESLGVIAPLQGMMLQSWDGALRSFPAWPRALEARYEHFRAEGAFLVSAAWANGRRILA